MLTWLGIMVCIMVKKTQLKLFFLVTSHNLCAEKKTCTHRQKLKSRISPISSVCLQQTADLICCLNNQMTKYHHLYSNTTFSLPILWVRCESHSFDIFEYVYAFPLNSMFIITCIESDNSRNTPRLKCI